MYKNNSRFSSEIKGCPNGRHFTIWQQFGAFFIHLIPSFILLAFLIIAWKWEKIGGIIFIVLGLGLSPFIFQRNYNMNHSIWMSLGIILAITFPFVIVGILFIVSHFKKKKFIEKKTSYYLANNFQ